ncbi:hypothetical protein EYF80_048921 [Liparis tanakae]|uniref:Uncharacterized protein n=1 Tax=Liparis tanakae TaxID=230148 RepID=A0A4Z2FJE8_9TELE|nr:hypothetical protein EYF80_048921 [Liparis tanakae]
MRKALKRWQLAASPVPPTLHTREKKNQGSISSFRRSSLSCGGGLSPCRGLKKQSMSFSRLQVRLLSREVMTSFTDVRTKATESCESYTGPLRGSRDADVAHGEHELDAPALPSLSPVSPHLEEPGEERVQLLGERPQGFGDSPQPALRERLEAQDAGLQVDHATAGHSGRRRHGQVLHLEHHGHHLRGRTTQNDEEEEEEEEEEEGGAEDGRPVDLTSVSLMISPELRHSFLLSSSTVFMFSIHTASTGPSNMYHFFSLSMEDAPPRITEERIPSYSPYSCPMVMALGLRTYV